MQNDINIKEMFDGIANDYDKLNNIISLGMHTFIKHKAIKRVPLQSNFKILDVCTGTGDIAIYVAKNIVKNGEVVGIDFSQTMLERAKTKATGIKNISFLKADALYLPFRNDEFDACFISFGLRNLPDIKKGLKELKRVTKSDGFVVNIDTGKPKGLTKIFYNLFFFKIVPLCGKIFHGNSSPYKYLPESTENFPSPDELVELFKTIGLKDVKKHNYLFGAISEQIGKV